MNSCCSIYLTNRRLHFINILTPLKHSIIVVCTPLYALKTHFRFARESYELLPFTYLIRIFTEVVNDSIMYKLDLGKEWINQIQNDL